MTIPSFYRFYYALLLGSKIYQVYVSTEDTCSLTAIETQSEGLYIWKNELVRKVNIQLHLL